MSRSNSYLSPANDSIIYESVSSSDSSNSLQRPVGSTTMPNRQGQRIPSTEESMLSRSPEEKLSTKIRRLQCLIVVLFLMFIALLFIYIASAVYVFTKVSHLRLDSNLSPTESKAFALHGQVGPGSERYSYCVNLDDVKPFRDVWEHLEYQKTADVICFNSFSWVTRIASLIPKKLEEKIQFLEEQVTTLLSRQGSSSATGNGSVPGLHLSGTPYSQRHFAHLFLDVNAPNTADGSEMGPIRWTRSGMDGSHTRGIDALAHLGELKIKQSGYYFIYSHVMYKVSRQPEAEGESNQRATPLIHSVFKNYKDKSAGGITKLLESYPDNKGPTSFLQGIFLLQKDDTISVCAPIKMLFNDSGRFTYFGAYLI